MVVIGMSGRGGGKMVQALRDTDVHICVPHERTARIQEVHLLTLHCLCDAVDTLLLGD
jgi:D-sedoheptulose 7-phosphate isomerase